MVGKGRSSRSILLAAFLIGATGVTGMAGPKPAAPSDAATYARDFGVSLQEAERRSP